MTHYCIHHLNDLSGSPLILRQRMDGMPAEAPPTLVTNQTEGFLSGWRGPTVRLPYVKYPGRVRRFISLSLWYLRAAHYLWRHLARGDRLTVSTLIASPLLAVLLVRPQVEAELLINEIFFRVPGWRSLGLHMARSARVTKIYLSRFVADHWRFGEPSRIVYPELRASLTALASTAEPLAPKDRDRLRFFLVASQTEAKGYRLFIDVARHYAAHGAAHSFHLYLSGDPAQFARDFPAATLPGNLSTTFNNASTEIFADKDVFLGLTNTALWLETFGQTFAEAMMMANIVVVPDAGAQLEYITDGATGFLFTSYSVAGVVAQIERIRAHDDLADLATTARRGIQAFYRDAAAALR